MKVKSESEVTELCPTLSNPMDCSPPGSSVHGIFQARVLEWVAIAFSNGILVGHNKEWEMPFPLTSHTKESKSERKREIPYNITYMSDLKQNTNDYIYKTETDIENRPVVVKKKGYGGGINWDFGISRYKLLYIG